MSQRFTAPQNQSTSHRRRCLSLPAAALTPFPFVAPASIPLPPSPVTSLTPTPLLLSPAPSPAPAPLPLSPAAVITAMSDESPHSYSGVPRLTKLNYTEWAMQVEAYLTGAADHWRVIKGAEKPDGTYNRPAPPTDTTTLAWSDWKKSERVACGVLMASAGDLHGEVIL
jgi:hypothetical protein